MKIITGVFFYRSRLQKLFDIQWHPWNVWDNNPKGYFKVSVRHSKCKSAVLEPNCFIDRSCWNVLVWPIAWDLVHLWQWVPELTIDFGDSKSSAYTELLLWFFLSFFLLKGVGLAHCLRFGTSFTMGSRVDHRFWWQCLHWIASLVFFHSLFLLKLIGLAHCLRSVP